MDTNFISRYTSVLNAQKVLEENGHDCAGFEATYSAEDDKLRIYYPYRSERVIYDAFVDMGFKSAPLQECIFAKWTPARADFCLIVAEGEIEPEGTTLAERASAKADRLDGYRSNRLRDAGHYQQAANRYSERFAMGQPILVGHHSERSARVAQNRAHNAMHNAVDHLRRANYWSYRAEGVEHHANRKQNPDVRARRIKTLLKELRTHQTAVNDAHSALELWEIPNSLTKDDKRHELIQMYVSGQFGRITKWSTYNQLDNGEVTHDEVMHDHIKHYQMLLDSPHQGRWIEHILNRLGYENEMLGKTPRYEDALKAVVLQKFCRVHGAEKPKAKKNGEGFTVSSDVDLPLHIGQGKELTLTCSEWCDLMQNCGYVVEANTPRRTTIPLLNIDTDEHQRQAPAYCTEKVQTFRVERMTKAEYSATRQDSRGVCKSLCGQYRFKTVFISTSDNHSFSGYRAAVYITDSKTHPKPEAPEQQQAA